MEASGGRVRKEEHRDIVVVIDGQDIEVRLREKLRKVRRPLTAQEKRMSWNDGKETASALQASGYLLFEVRTWVPDHGQRQWLESNQQSLEMLLPDILAGLLDAGPRLAEQRRKREQEAREHQLAERRRYEEQQRLRREANRRARLLELARAAEDAERVRGFLGRIRAAGLSPDVDVAGRTVQEWMEWAEASVDAADPLAWGAQKIFEEIASITEFSLTVQRSDS